MSSKRHQQGRTETNGIAHLESCRIFGLDYCHITLRYQDDLYLTSYGMPFKNNLLPENFYTDQEWFAKHAVRLEGTSTIYRIPTKKINGRQKEIVLKWNRMGQNIPGAEENEALGEAEFNSPFEEFTLLVELRETVRESPGGIITQKPLAVYVPHKPVELWQLGRREYKMRRKIDIHEDITLDMNRNYAVIYEWIKGIDAVQAYREGMLEQKNIEELAASVARKLHLKGFQVRDLKPHHIIIRPRGNRDFIRDRQGEILYGLIDYELLSRTGEREQQIKLNQRHRYLVKQRDRFKPAEEPKLPPHLKYVTFFDVDYIWGHAESTGGTLWVVGKDPDLFDYFLPERWETTHRTKLSAQHEIYHTVTKDNINLVWKVSQVGIIPDLDPFKDEEREILNCGFNSPFEEVSIALELSRKGIRAVYPRAIYKSGHQTSLLESLQDKSRYRSHAGLKNPDQTDILQEGYHYTLIWGYWNGPDEMLAASDSEPYSTRNALHAYQEGIISEYTYFTIMNMKRKRLSTIGIKDLNLRGTHLLLSFSSNGTLITDAQGLPDVRICNFEFLKRVPL